MPTTNPEPHSQALLGRDEELALVVASVGEGRGMVLAGASGVGKSRLLREVADHLMHDGVAVHKVFATPAAVPLPFGAFADMWPQGGELTPERLLGHILNALATEAREQHLVLAVDDAHLLDDASASVVHVLVTRELATVVASVRSHEPCPASIQSLWKDGHVDRLELQALSRADCDRLVSDMLGSDVAKPTLDRLWELSQGVPLLVRELVLDARDAGELVHKRGVWTWTGELAFQPRLADVAGLRLSRLSEPAQRTLARVAFGEPLPGAMVPLIAAEPDLLELEQAGMVEVRSELRLSHPLFGEAVRATTPPALAATVQRELADAWLAFGATTREDLARLAVLALEGGRSLDHEILLRVAEDALQLSDYPAAERAARAAGDRSGRGGLALARALNWLYRYEEARDLLAGIDPMVLTEKERVTWTSERISGIGRGLSDVPGAVAAFEEGTRLVEDPGWRGVMTAELAFVLDLNGQAEGAAAMAGALHEHPDVRVRLASMQGTGTRLCAEGRPVLVADRAAELIGDAVTSQAEMPDAPLWVATAYTTALACSGRLADLDQFLDVIEGGIVPLGDETRTLTLLMRGRLRLLQGLPATAARVAREAASALEGVGDPRAFRWALSVLAEASAIRGDAMAASAAWQEAVNPDLPCREPWDWDGERSGVWVLAAGGDLAGATALAMELADRWQDEGLFGMEAFVLHDALRLGVVRDIAPRLEICCAKAEGSWAEAFSVHARGLREGNGSRLDEASAAFEAFGAILNAAEASAEASRAYAEQGLAARASAASARASVLADRCEGARTPALSAPSELVGLTPRERQVAELAARALTSPQIAAQLGLSERTVETHLGRVFTKLGIQRRNELAAILGLKA